MEEGERVDREEREGREREGERITREEWQMEEKSW